MVRNWEWHKGQFCLLKSLTDTELMEDLFFLNISLLRSLWVLTGSQECKEENIKIVHLLNCLGLGKKKKIFHVLFSLKKLLDPSQIKRKLTNNHIPGITLFSTRGLKQEAKGMSLWLSFSKKWALSPVNF